MMRKMSSLTILLLFLSLLLVVKGEGYAGPSPASKPAPIPDLSAEQLPSWAALHPGGAGRRTTTLSGNPVTSNTASLSLGKGGPLLMDHLLLEKLSSLNAERIPERVVHAQGQGAFGHFVVTHDVSRWTKAKVFNPIGKVTRTFARFSSTFKSRGASETFPDPRGFAIKFYTEDGNLDFAGRDVPAFFTRDPMLFADTVRSLKTNPQTGIFDNSMFYDFFSLRPEIVHNWIRFFADESFLGSVRAMNASTVNVHLCTNAQGEQFYCKFSWQSWQDIPNLTELQAFALASSEPSYYTKDLYNAIASGNFPKWTLGLQVISPEQVDSLPFNAFDITKVWRVEEFPFYPIGVLVLDKNPTNHFAQVEQSAFCPGNLVPGIGITQRDKVMVARVFAYKNAQRHRLGSNFELIEVNRPLSRVDSYQRDGPMMTSAQDNGDGGPVYFPNSFNGPRIDPATEGWEESSLIQGVISRVDTMDDDNFSQPREWLEKDVGVEERARIAFRIATHMSTIVPQLKARVLVNCVYPLGKEFGDMVVRSLQIIESRSAGIYQYPQYNNTTMAPPTAYQA